MFGKKSDSKTKRNHSGKSLSQYGLFDVGMGMDGGMNKGDDDDDNDSDLEAELMALSGGNPKPKRPQKKPVSDANLNAMVAESLRDLPSDDDISVDENDPDLLNELNDIAGGEMEESPTEDVEEVRTEVNQSTSSLTVLEARLKMYEAAEKHAKESGETGRARRFGRGIKTLKDLMKHAKSGKPINDDDIPPEVTIGASKPKAEPAVPNSEPEPQPEPPERPPRLASMDLPVTPVSVKEPSAQDESEIASTPSGEIDNELLKTLQQRHTDYKVAALQAKRSGDSTTAIGYLKIAKQFETVITAVENGQPVDTSRMPGPPGSAPSKVQHEETQKNTPVPEEPIPDDEPARNLIRASSVGEALVQHMDVYRKQEEAAKEQGNAGKARRMGRIIKQFEQAIKLHKAGKPIPAEDLPTPPGYAALTVPGAAKPAPQPGTPSQPSVTAGPAPRPAPKPPISQSTRISGNHVPNSRAEQQMIILLAKQKQFKEAALNAKKKGEITQAKEFLRTAKGFDKLIEASSCGLPVDFSTLPVSPDAKSHLDQEYDVIMAEECTEKDGDDLDVLTRLEGQLSRQLKMCLTTRDHHKALGDVAGTNRFERLALNVTKDLDIIRLAQKSAGRTPKFHYENKEFSMVKSFTELGDNDLELTILRGINYNTNYPKDIDTYVKFDFPFPQETPYSSYTSTVKNTNNPEYNATFTIPIQRTLRACQRVFKRHAIKFEVYSRGGFFRSDTLIGTANVKLQTLETQCELHESFDLLEGRKKNGGKIEVRLRLRHPIVAQEVEQIKEKWLVIDQ